MEEKKKKNVRAQILFHHDDNTFCYFISDSIFQSAMKLHAQIEAVLRRNNNTNKQTNKKKLQQQQQQRITCNDFLASRAPA